jgi:hypothetical protein
MVDLADHDEVTSAREALYDPDLPQGLATVEMLRHHARGETLELPAIAGLGQRDVSDVVVNIEMLVIHPHRMIRDRHIRQPLAVTGNEMQAGGDVVANRIDIDATIGCLQRLGFKCGHPGHVHGARRRLHEEKRTVEEAETVVRIGAHRDVASRLRPSTCRSPASGPAPRVSSRASRRSPLRW